MKKIGPLGTFSEGKIDETDEGDLMIGVTTYRGEVRIDFGKKVAWVAFSREIAIELANVILRRANELPGAQ